MTIKTGDADYECRPLSGVSYGTYGDVGPKPQPKPMSMVKVTSEYGLVIRRRALQERGVSQAGLQDAMEGVNLLDENDDLISFGPCFGQETLDVLICRLSALGLSYFDDFVEVVADYPSWCQPARSYAQPMKGGGE